MFDYFKKGVTENYANFSGRARRAEYWYFALFYVLFYIALAVIGGLIRFPFIVFIYLIAVIVPTFAVGVRRMHDVGKSGWYILIPIYSLILALTEGEKGPNQYGPDPKNPAADIADHLVG